MIPERIQAAMSEWVAGVDVSTWSLWAESQADIVPHLERDLGAKRHLVRFLLNGREQQAIQAAQKADWDAFLSRLVETVPGQGLVLWQHQAWYFTQMARVQQAILALLPASSETPAPTRYTGAKGGDRP